MNYQRKEVSLTARHPIVDAGFFVRKEDSSMETRVAIIGIVVENQDSVSKLNDILHAYSRYIIGRMGVPYKERKVSLISIMVDGPSDAISSLSGKIGQLSGVTAKAIYSRMPEE